MIFVESVIDGRSCWLSVASGGRVLEALGRCARIHRPMPAIRESPPWAISVKNREWFRAIGAERPTHDGASPFSSYRPLLSSSRKLFDVVSKSLPASAPIDILLFDEHGAQRLIAIIHFKFETQKSHVHILNFDRFIEFIGSIRSI